MSIGRNPIGRAAIGRSGDPAPPPPVSLPMSLAGFVSVAAASVPMRLRGATQTAAGTIPLRLEGALPSHYQGSAAAWTVTATLDDVDITAKLAESIEIRAEENTSTLATFVMIPAAGTVNPDDYERKSVSISFVGLDAAGATLYTQRRYTGVTTRAVYDPDGGLLTIEATTDLQGQLENISRDQIDTLIADGQWSKHVFDDAATGWQYALDRLSTTPAALWCNPAGQVVVTDWAAKATADVEFTDAGRFAGTLALERNTRRDIISRNQLNIDFRFVRLRHRQMLVNFVHSIGFCGYLDGEATVPQRAMIQAAADSNAWTRLSEIDFTPLPDVGTYCGGKNWTGGGEDFCLGAIWTAARRWAQTITEAYALTVFAPDIEAAIGVQAVSEDYGLEAIYDAGDYERIDAFDGPPSGATFVAATQDYQLDADETEAHGRTELEAAQTCAIAKARVEILGRARGNRVRVGAVYDPMITLASTVRVNTPDFVAKGKVFAYTERFNLNTGEPSLDLTLALSRHGGSGTASDDSIAAAGQPAQPAETPTPRTYQLGVRAGGVTGAPADSDAWDGYICNAYSVAQTDPSNLYRERFVLNMPEIEDAARDATEVAQPASYEVAVPQDELTMSY